MEKACFTNISSEIISLLNNAKSEVLVAMAWFTSAELFEALQSCISRKVHVELILLDSPTNFMYYAPDFNRLLTPHSCLRIAKQDVGIMHHKFCIIDSKLVITGSYNWTYRAETYNIENVLITDVSSIVCSYRQEFDQLASNIEISTYSPRLTWNEIQQRDDVDVREINYEIKHICKTRNLPVMNVIKASTVVQVVETKRIPYANRYIGIEVIDNNKNYFDSFIEPREQLPIKTKTHNLYFDSMNETVFPCTFICGTTNNRDSAQLIKEVNLIDLTKGISDLNLLIQFSMSLDVNGSLRIDITCPATGKKMMISDINSNYVKYE